MWREANLCATGPEVCVYNIIFVFIYRPLPITTVICAYSMHSLLLPPFPVAALHNPILVSTFCINVRLKFLFEQHTAWFVSAGTVIQPAGHDAVLSHLDILTVRRVFRPTWAFTPSIPRMSNTMSTNVSQFIVCNAILTNMLLVWTFLIRWFMSYVCRPIYVCRLKQIHNTYICRKHKQKCCAMKKHNRWQRNDSTQYGYFTKLSIIDIFVL